MSNNKSKSNKVKWVFTAIAFVLVFALIVGLCLQVFGEGKMKPSEWFNNQTEEVQPDEQISGGGAIIDETKSNGVRLASATIAVADYDEYGISPLAETAYTLTATVYDEDSSSDGIPQDVIYTAKWQNPSSDWATGKDIADYYTVTSTGVNTATATCLQAFGEPIVITATSYFNEDAYCTWEANYVKRVTNITLSSMYNSFGFEENIGQDVSISYGTGTLTGKVTFTSFYISDMGTHLSNAVNNAYYLYFEQQAKNIGVTPDFDFSATHEINYEVDDENHVELYETFPSTMFKANMNSEDVTKLESATTYFEYFTYAYYFAADQGTNDIKYTAHYRYTYDGEEYSSGNVESDWFELTGWYPQPASVNGNDVDLIY